MLTKLKNIVKQHKAHYFYSAHIIKKDQIISSLEELTKAKSLIWLN